MQADAHLHAPALAQKEPDFMARLPVDGWRGALVAHDEEELAETLRLRAGMPPTLLGFGIHPQGLRWDTLGLLADLARDGKIDFVGEAGFDLFGDTLMRIRNEKNLAEQKRAFEY
ncbi:MAG: TatD family hydrolase, partial [Spirochaetaceae bacterium]|nr:TatD family hydrolase [Spirochaetaceae bacterium]